MNQDNGCYSVAKMSRITGLEPDTIRHFFKSSECHHASKYYNQVDYYELSEINEALCDPILGKKIKKYNTKMKVKPIITTYEKCDVEYLEWFGSANNRRSIVIKVSSCKVDIKGKTAYIYEKEGAKPTAKRLKTNGLLITHDHVMLNY